MAMRASTSTRRTARSCARGASPAPIPGSSTSPTTSAATPTAGSTSPTARTIASRSSQPTKARQDALKRGGAMTESEADVLRADDRRFEAMRKGDFVALEAALADDLTYVHSTARLESKAEHIGNLKAGKPHYRGIAPRDRKARVHGNVGVVNGVSEMHVENAGKEQRFTVRYLAIYARTDHWRMIAWQSTKVPDA